MLPKEHWIVEKVNINNQPVLGTQLRAVLKFTISCLAGFYSKLTPYIAGYVRQSVRLTTNSKIHSRERTDTQLEWKSKD